MLVSHRLEMRSTLTARRHIFRCILSVWVLILVSAGFAAAQVDPPATDDPAAIFNMAQDLHEKGDLEGAVKLYDKALAILPQFPEAAFQRASALASLGRKTDAVEGYKQAAQLRPDWPLPYSAMGGLLLEIGRLAEARLSLNKALELEPSDPQALAYLATLEVAAKASPDVLNSLLSRIGSLTTRSNASASLWSARAGLERALGRSVAVRLSLEKAIAADPRDRNAIFLLGEQAVEDGDLERARSLAARLEVIAPGSGSAHILRSEISAKAGDTAAALKELDTISASDPRVAERRARLLANSPSDVAELEKQLAAAPNSGPILGRLCSEYRRTDPAKALAYCKRASEAEPNNVDHAVGFGAALVQAKQYEPAVILLRKLTNFAPGNWTAHANLATALFQLNKFAEAKQEYDWLAQKQPDAAAPHLFLAIVHDRLGELTDALLEYRAYLKLADPAENKADIDKVNLRLPALEKEIKKGKKN